MELNTKPAEAALWPLGRPFVLEVMSVPSQENKEKVRQIKKWFEKSDALLVLRYRGLRVSEADELREQVKSMNSEMRVMKNTLARIALAGTANEGLVSLLDGPVAMVFVHDDPAPIARSLRDFARGRKEFHLLGGMLEGKVLDGKQVEAFAMLPPREALIAQALGVAVSPLSSFATVIAGPIRKLMTVMRAISENANQASEPPPQGAEGAAEGEGTPAEPAEPVDVGGQAAAETAAPDANAEETGEAAADTAAPEENTDDVHDAAAETAE